jgi:hypothetical protein
MAQETAISTAPVMDLATDINDERQTRMTMIGPPGRVLSFLISGPV